MKHILLVEPDEALASTIGHFIESDETTVNYASDAQQAISQADSQRPDAVVLELAMSRHNGVEFLQEFRSYPDWMSVPVVIYSQIAPEDTGLSRAEWHKSGVIDYLYKPTARLHQLKAVLQQIEDRT